MKLTFELVDLERIERLDGEQGVDEEPVTARSRNAAGGGVRARDEAKVFQVRHHVADARRRKLEPRIPRQSPRADRLSVRDIALDERLQKDLRALVQHRGVA